MKIITSDRTKQFRVQTNLRFQTDSCRDKKSRTVQVAFSQSQLLFVRDREMDELTLRIGDWSFNVRPLGMDEALDDETGTDDLFSGSFFETEDKPGHEKNVRRR